MESNNHYREQEFRAAVEGTDVFNPEEKASLLATYPMFSEHSVDEVIRLLAEEAVKVAAIQEKNEGTIDTVRLS